MSERQPILTVAGAAKAYSRTNKALHSAGLSLHSGEITALLGPSGSGKSTLLRAIAGLERLDAGEIRCGSHVWDSQAEFLAPERRRVGMVFQDYALFPHLDALSNVAFGLNTSNAKQIAMKQLEMAELADKAKAFPHQLSGGEQQRVALARALAPEPSIVLLDEPFSGLDRRLRRELRQRTIDTLRRNSAAVLLVTHDAEEALGTADTVALMREGRIVQSGTPHEVWQHPVNAEAARLTGDINSLNGQVDESGHVTTVIGALPAPELSPGDHAGILIRPEALTITNTGEFRIINQTYSGGRSLYQLEGPDKSIWLVHNSPVDNPGSTVGLQISGPFAVNKRADF